MIWQSLEMEIVTHLSIMLVTEEKNCDDPWKHLFRGLSMSEEMFHFKLGNSHCFACEEP